jgi:anti-anti-sigma factor
MGPQLTIVYLPGDPGFLAVRGEVDLCTVPRLEGCLRRAVRAAPPGAAVMVNLSAVSFIDARGLWALAEAEAYACVRGIRLVFADVPASITRLLAIAGLSLRGVASA